jgi:iron complex transport system permease protein
MSFASFSAGAAKAFAEKRRGTLLVVTIALVTAALLIAVAALTVGAVAIPPGRVTEVLFAWLSGDAAALSSREALVILNIRLPRLILGALVGAGLAVAGALMQGLFRNPLADPGLVGVSAGAGLAAAVTIVLGDRLLAGVIGKLPFAALPAGAFLGGLLTTTVLYLIATREGRTSVATMLLAGVALGALAGAMTGFLAFLSDDRQLRDLTFWSLGSLSGASWIKVWAIAPVIVILLGVTAFLARGLDALSLGEAEAWHLGVPVQKLKLAIIVLTALAVGASVAAAGLIGFIGIVVPHMLRLLIGPGHRALLPLAALSGAALLVVADTIARIVVAPAELPIGIVTAAIGAPFFLWLLLRGDRSLA